MFYLIHSFIEYRASLLCLHSILYSTFIWYPAWSWPGHTLCIVQRLLWTNLFSHQASFWRELLASQDPKILIVLIRYSSILLKKVGGSFILLGCWAAVGMDIAFLSILGTKAIF